MRPWTLVGIGSVAHLVALPPLELEQALVAQHPHRLLEEERVAAGVGDQRSREAASPRVRGRR